MQMQPVEVDAGPDVAHRTAERVLALQSSPLATAVLDLSRQELSASEVQVLERLLP